MTTLEAYARGDWTQTIHADTEQSHVGTMAHYRYQDVFTLIKIRLTYRAVRPLLGEMGS